MFNPDIHYLSKKTCSNNHKNEKGLTIRYKKSDRCVICNQIRSRRGYHNNKDKYRARHTRYQRIYRQAKRDKIKLKKQVKFWKLIFNLLCSKNGFILLPTWSKSLKKYDYYKVIRKEEKRILKEEQALKEKQKQLEDWNKRKKEKLKTNQKETQCKKLPNLAEQYLAYKAKNS